MCVSILISRWATGWVYSEICLILVVMLCWNWLVGKSILPFLLITSVVSNHITVNMPCLGLACPLVDARISPAAFLSSLPETSGTEIYMMLPSDWQVVTSIVFAG